MRLMAGPSVFSVATSGLMSPQSKLMVGRAAGSISLDGTGRLLSGVCSHAWASALKRRMFSVMATSVGRRSMLDAPKNPTTPSVRSSTYRASSGSASGPPWQSTITSGLTATAASRIAWISSTHSSSVSAVSAPIVPFVVSPMCGTSTSAPARVIASADSGSNTYGAVSSPIEAASRIISTSRPYPIPVSSRFARKVPSISPTVGKFCTPANPASRTSRRKFGMSRKGSVPHTPASTGVSRTIGSTSRPISMTIALASPYGRSPASDLRAGEAFAESLEQCRIGLGVVERLVLCVDHRDALQRHEQAYGARRLGELARDPAPQLRALLPGGPHERHRRVVHVEVAVLELRRHGVARAEVDHVERAERHDLRHAGAPGGLEPGRPGRQHAAHEVVAQLGRRDVEHAGQEPAVHERLHGLAAGAGRVEDKHLVALLLERLARGCDAGRRYPEHRGRHQ